MKYAYLVLAISSLLFACSPQMTEISEEADDSPQSSGVIQMGLEAQRHVGLEVAPTAVTQMTEYLRVTGTSSRLTAR
jgi:hypothetical protein